MEAGNNSNLLFILNFYERLLCFAVDKIIVKNAIQDYSEKCNPIKFGSFMDLKAPVQMFLITLKTTKIHK